MWQCNITSGFKAPLSLPRVFQATSIIQPRIHRCLPLSHTPQILYLSGILYYLMPIPLIPVIVIAAVGGGAVVFLAIREVLRATHQPRPIPVPARNTNHSNHPKTTRRLRATCTTTQYEIGNTGNTMRARRNDTHLEIELGCMPIPEVHFDGRGLFMANPCSDQTISRQIQSKDLVCCNPSEYGLHTERRYRRNYTPSHKSYNQRWIFDFVLHLRPSPLPSVR